MIATKLYDLTSTNVALEMYRRDSDPLADPTFRRHVHEVTTAGSRASTAARLRPDLRVLPFRYRRFSAVPKP